MGEFLNRSSFSISKKQLFVCIWGLSIRFEDRSGLTWSRFLFLIFLTIMSSFLFHTGEIFAAAHEDFRVGRQQLEGLWSVYRIDKTIRQGMVKFCLWRLWFCYSNLSILFFFPPLSTSCKSGISHYKFYQFSLIPAVSSPMQAWWASLLSTGGTYANIKQYNSCFRLFCTCLALQTLTDRPVSIMPSSRDLNR